MASSPIVARINSLLAEKGISKKTFYRECGISSASYSLWNTGKTQPRMKNLEVIAKFLNVPVSYLVDGETIYLLNKAVPFGPHLSIDDIVINSGAEIEQKENPTEKPGEVNTDNISELLEKMPTPDLIELLGEITETLKRRGEK